MWVEEIDEFFKGYLPFYVLIFLPIFIIVSPINPIHASHEFPVYRMQHFDLHGAPHGSRSASVNHEARSLASWKTVRHCVVTRMKDLTNDTLRDIRTKAGALLIIFPENIAALAEQEKEHLSLVESAIMGQDVPIPVYLIKDSPEFEKIFKEITDNSAANDLKKSAAEALYSSVAANGYQIVISPGTPSVKKDLKLATIQGQLVANNNLKDEKISTIAIVAHYDSFGIAPELSFGADSNGSGVVVLLELIRLFSQLYKDPKTHGKFNIIFLLTGGGKINYVGSKKWLEDQLDSLDGSIIQGASFVMCLDSLANNDPIYMHVSKPPKEGTPSHSLYKQLKSASERHLKKSVESVHKKINLNDETLAWEHERYSKKKLPAFTLSTLRSHRDNARNTIFDVRRSGHLDKLTKKTRIIADALIGHIYNNSDAQMFGKDVDKNHLETWLNLVTNQPRSPQLLSNKDNHLIKSFKEFFENHLSDTKVYYASPDKRDPEFNFYDISKSTVNIYSVKPAVFDLFLTVAIAIYLTLVYFFIQKFSSFYNLACSLTAKQEQKKK